MCFRHKPENVDKTCELVSAYVELTYKPEKPQSSAPKCSRIPDDETVRFSREPDEEALKALM